MALDQCETFEITAVLGDLNAKVGNLKKNVSVTGGHGLAERNGRHDRLTARAKSRDMIIRGKSSL